MMLWIEKNPGKLAALAGVVTTLAVNPWFAYDPINLPKMFAMSFFAALMGCALMFNWRRVVRLNLLVIASFVVMLLGLTLSLVIGDAPFGQQFFGTWGRSTGYLTYISFLMVTLYVACFAEKSDFSLLRTYLEKLSYAISFYTLLQWADLDPINWSQKLMIATLGNINFMSSFLGLVSCSFLVRVFLDKISLSARLFFLLMTSLNLLMIIVSGSIQGLAIILSGIALIIVLVARIRFGTIASILTSVTTLTLGFFVLLGTAGVGPLSRLRQETVLYRLDYWKAGWRMSLSEPVLGVGIDSYGDYYRQFRDLEAVLRTGPQRVTNTAHNIFLDISSGAGFITAIAFLTIFIVLVFSVAKLVISPTLDADLIAWSSIFLGFFVFCLISINQIGVGIWGFVAIGLLLSQLRKKEPADKKFKSKGNKKHDSYHRISGGEERLPDKKFFKHAKYANSTKSIAAIALTTPVFLVALLANLTDVRVLTSIKSNNLEAGLKLVNEIGASDFHREVLISNLTKAGMNAEALELARLTSAKNPRNWTAWVSIVANENSSMKEKRLAANQLFVLDPNNREVRAEIEDFLRNGE